MYEINGKRVLVQRVPGISDIFSNFSPKTQQRIIVAICILFIISCVMDHFNLRLGGIASEEQLRYGTFAQNDSMTGPNINYSLEAQNIVRAEAMKRDLRIKGKWDVNIAIAPERYPTLYAGVVDRRNGYIGQGRYQVLFWYIVRDSAGKSVIHYGYGRVRLVQEPLLFFVKQVWVLEDFKITHKA